MQSIKEKFFQTLDRKCQEVGIRYTVTDTVDWTAIKNYIEKDEIYDSKMPLEAFIADVFNSLLDELGSATNIDTYHESVGYIVERSIVYYLISKCNIQNPDWVLGWINFFISDGHFEEISFIPFKYLIKPYFDDTESITKGKYDLYYLLKDRWTKTGYLYITERRVNEFLETL